MNGSSRELTPNNSLKLTWQPVTPFAGAKAAPERPCSLNSALGVMQYFRILLAFLPFGQCALACDDIRVPIIANSSMSKSQGFLEVYAPIDYKNLQDPTAVFIWKDGQIPMHSGFIKGNQAIFEIQATVEVLTSGRLEINYHYKPSDGGGISLCLHTERIYWSAPKNDT
jgi:hypothetical protein